MCCACGTKEKSLQVHHLYYAKKDPWDYSDDAYQTLCEDCHYTRQEIVDRRIGEIRVVLGSITNSNLDGVLLDLLDSISRTANTPVAVEKGRSLFKAMREGNK